MNEKKGSIDQIIDVNIIAQDLIDRYGSLKGISVHSPELVKKYGHIIYSQIVWSVKHFHLKKATKKGGWR